MKADLSHELTTNSLKFDFNHFFTVDSKQSPFNQALWRKGEFCLPPPTHTHRHTCIVKKATSIFHPNHCKGISLLCAREKKAQILRLSSSRIFKCSPLLSNGVLHNTLKWFLRNNLQKRNKLTTSTSFSSRNEN